VKEGLSQRAKTEKARRMGPRVRGDDEANRAPQLFAGTTMTIAALANAANASAVPLA
jgi:hypothetical protein